MENTVQFQMMWLSSLFEELITMIFYGVTG
jgi:hypothetical protein